MTIDDMLPFLESNHLWGVTTFRKNGAAQVSILSSRVYRGKAVFVVAGNTAKLANLKRDPRCSALTVKADWSAYAVVEGTTEFHTWDNTDHEELRLLLREIYKACGGDHPDYNEYDRLMRAQ
jgi:uncharacterized pyridoxamine 5'-phosphate oxidase family protein